MEISKIIFAFFLLTTTSFTTVFGQELNSSTTKNGYYLKDSTYISDGYYHASPIKSFEVIDQKIPESKSEITAWMNSNDRRRKPKNDYSTSNNTQPYLGITTPQGEKVIKYEKELEMIGLCYDCENVRFNKNTAYTWYSPEKGVNQSLGKPEGQLLDSIYKIEDLNDNILFLAHYKRGILHGASSTYDKNGRKLTEAIFNNGNIKKSVKTFDSSGLLEFEMFIKNGQRHGKHIAYFKNGTIEKISYFKDDIQTGTILEYNNLGELIYEYHAENQIPNGTFQQFQYDLNGNKIYETKGEFLNGEKHGSWKCYFVKDHQRKLVGNIDYSNNLLHGNYMIYQSPDTIVQSHYIQGKQEGEYILKTKKSKDKWQIEIKGNYIKDRQEKLWIYYQNDRIKHSGSFERNKRQGTWSYFDHIKNTIARTEYEQGIKEGKYALNDSLSNTLLEGQFTQDKRTGIWKHFNTDRKLIQTDEYDEETGNIVLSKFYNSEQNLILSYHYKGDQEVSTIIRYDGSPEKNILRETNVTSNNRGDYQIRVSEFNIDSLVIQDYKIKQVKELTDTSFLRGEKDGVYQLIVKEKKQEEGSYLKGKKYGTWITYLYPSGIKVESTIGVQIKKYYSIKNSELFSGKYQHVHKNLIETIKVKKGLLHGKTMIKDQEQNKVAFRKYKKGILKNSKTY